MGGLSGLGYSAVSIAADAYSAKQARKAAKKQRAWAKKMDNTIYQRRMKDMAKAGLNPMLMASLGAGGAPPGAMAQNQGVNAAAAIQAGGSASKISQEKTNLAKTGDNLDAQKTLTHALERTENAKEHAFRFTNAKTISDTKVADRTAENLHVNTALNASRLPGAKAEAGIDRTPYGKALRFMGRMNPFSGPIGSLFKAGAGK